MEQQRQSCQASDIELPLTNDLTEQDWVYNTYTKKKKNESDKKKTFSYELIPQWY